MSIEPNIDNKFHRAVDIVQSLPKGGPIQTTYEEKLWLYSLYKQATEGDIRIPRPGMLDLLGKAKWDSWHKQEGKTKTEAKAHYVEALCKILERNGGEEEVEGFLTELEGMSGLARFNMAPRPASPASSTSSYHSSQASPPLSPGHSPRAPRDQNQDISLEPSSMDPQGVLLPPDPLLPPPDVAPSFVPPSALTSSHRSLLSLSQEQEAADTYQPLHLPPRPVPYVGSRAQSSRGDPQDSRVVRDLLGESGPGSVQSFRQRQGYDRPVALDPRAGSRLASPSIPPPLPRDYVHTPEMQGSAFASLGLDGTPIYQSQKPPGPGSASTYGPPPPLNISYTLQQIQTSLAALHERLSTLERTQAMILRSDGRKKSWLWWSTEGDDLDQAEAEAERERWGFTTVTRQRQKKKPLSLRVVWFLLKALRRVLVDAGVGAVLIFIVWIMLNGGVKRARVLLGLIKMRARRLITGGL